MPCQALLDASASIDLSDALGVTALHVAAKCGHFGAVQGLIDAAANVAWTAWKNIYMGKP